MKKETIIILVLCIVMCLSLCSCECSTCGGTHLIECTECDGTGERVARDVGVRALPMNVKRARAKVRLNVLHALELANWIAQIVSRNKGRLQS